MTATSPKGLVLGRCEDREFSSIYRTCEKRSGWSVTGWSSHRSLSEEEIIMRGAEAYLPGDDEP